MENIQKIIFTLEEKKYREKLFAGDSSNILNCDITCTVCNGKLNWMIFSKKQILVHPILEVLLCEGCLIAHAASEWLGFCMWCGANTENLRNCTKCPISFCQNCIRVNFGLRGVIQSKLEKDWECYVCDPRKIWMPRAICSAFREMAQQITRADKINAENERDDCAVCLEQLDDIEYLACAHAFHQECLKKGVKATTRSCPVCHSSYAAGSSSAIDDSYTSPPTPR